MEIQYEHAFLGTMYFYLGKWLINFLDNLINTEHFDNPTEHSKMELMASLIAQLVKNPPAKYSRCEFNPWLGRFLGEGNGNPLQYSCLEHSMDREEPGRLLSMGSQKSWT